MVTSVVTSPLVCEWILRVSLPSLCGEVLSASAPLLVGRADLYKGFLVFSPFNLATKGRKTKRMKYLLEYSMEHTVLLQSGQ